MEINTKITISFVDEDVLRYFEQIIIDVFALLKPTMKAQGDYLNIRRVVVLAGKGSLPQTLRNQGEKASRVSPEKDY
ncbi:hypothetical protein [Paenibacillus amylolyticus]|uniref:hypothetical protein n=1 Tax=Paenibacillus amylolyticus TaxID=1451 RepID=UPI003D964CB8